MKVICVFLIHVFEKEIGITDNWHKKIAGTSRYRR